MLPQFVHKSVNYLTGIIHTVRSDGHARLCCFNAHRCCRQRRCRCFSRQLLLTFTSVLLQLVIAFNSHEFFDKVVQGTGLTAPIWTTSIMHPAIVLTRKLVFTSEVFFTERLVARHVRLDTATSTGLIKCTLLICFVFIGALNRE